MTEQWTEEMERKAESLSRTGLDLSPGDPLWAAALAELTRLREENERLKVNMVAQHDADVAAAQAANVAAEAAEAKLAAEKAHHHEAHGPDCENTEAVSAEREAHEQTKAKLAAVENTRDQQSIQIGEWMNYRDRIEARLTAADAEADRGREQVRVLREAGDAVLASCRDAFGEEVSPTISSLEKLAAALHSSEEPNDIAGPGMRVRDLDDKPLRHTKDCQETYNASEGESECFCGVEQ